MFGTDGEIRGIIPRSVEYLFSSLAKRANSAEVAMVCSFLEIYNDQIRDLGKAYLVAMGVENSSSLALYEKTSDIFENLAGKRGNPYFAPAFHRPGSAMASNVEDRPGLKEVQDEYNTMNYEIREDNEGNVFVKDLTLVPVTTMEEVMSLINMGLRVRATHETKMNAVSSRSHTVFTITVLQRDKITGQAITGMLNLVDLAGSERLKKSESQGIRLKEALHINTSLTALGKVIMALDPSSENTHVPYRDSKLTRVLQNSLGGNSFTSVIAAIHPSPKYYEECLSTLQFANRCRNVRNNPRVNYVDDNNEDKDRKIKKLMEEIAQLRTKLAQAGAAGVGGMGGSGGRGGGDGAFHPAKLITVLKLFGINATMSGDNQGIMVNGKKFSLDEIMSVVSALGGDASGGPGLGGPDGGGSMDGYGGMKSRVGTADGAASAQNLEKLQKTIKELKETNETYSMRAKERKSQLEEQTRELQKLSAELVKCRTVIKHKEFEYNSLLEEKDRLLAEQKSLLEKQFQEEKESLTKSNEELLKLSYQEKEKMPQSLKQYTVLLNKFDKQLATMEKPLKAEFTSHLTHLEKTRELEISNMKKQYDYWLQEKDKALSGFVDAFNLYRNKKTEQLRMAEQEIVKLYEYTEQIETILDNVEKGVYQVKQKQGNKGGKSTTGIMASFNGGLPTGGEGADETLGAVVLPKGIRPMNPLKVPTTLGSGLELTKKIVEKHKERVSRLEKMKEEAFQKSLHLAAQTGAMATGQLDDVLKSQVANLLVAKTPKDANPKNKDPLRKQGSNLTGLEGSGGSGSLGKQGKTPSSTNINRDNDGSFKIRPAGSAGGVGIDPLFNPGSVTAPGKLEGGFLPVNQWDIESTSRPITKSSMGQNIHSNIPSTAGSLNGGDQQHLLTKEIMAELEGLRRKAKYEAVSIRFLLLFVCVSCRALSTMMQKSPRNTE